MTTAPTSQARDPYAAARPTTPPGKVFTVTGQDWDSVVAGVDLERRRSASSSTWVRSTRRRTACCG